MNIAKQRERIASKLAASLGGNIKTARKSAGITQAQLADMIGRERTTVVHIENGHTLCSMTNLGIISVVLSIPIHQFFSSKEQFELWIPKKVEV